MISIVDYGVANLGSMLNMLRKVGARAECVSTAEALDRAEKIILPGVGAFDNGMSALKERNLVASLKKKVLEDKVPILGVCLGMQMLGRGSEEGSLPGLGLLDAYCKRFSFAERSRQKVPHMGWSLLVPQRPGSSLLLDGLDSQARFYFVHSYHLVCAEPEDVLANASYGVEFVAMVQRGNVCGAQFHPEKSHRFGMALLHNFARM
jgi:imidazole glycerol-phosphate synthase subunit HisH